MITTFPPLQNFSCPVCFEEYPLFKKAGEQPEIEIQDLSLSFGRKRVINRLSMKVAGGDITALVGPRGSGKTVLLRCINRLNDLIPNVHIEGRVMIDGRNVYEHRIDLGRLQRLVGLVGPQPNPFPMSVYENVAYAANLRNPVSDDFLDAMVEEALQAVDLWDGFEQARSHQALTLSLSDRQRLCIARILAMRPKILLFDEPYQSFGSLEVEKIDGLIASLTHRHTILLATRDREAAERIASRCIVLQSGHLIDPDDETDRFPGPSDPSKPVSRKDPVFS